MQSKLRRKKEGILRSETEGNSTYAGRKYFLPGSGFGRGMHAVLGNFVDAALRRLLMGAVEMVERTGAFADGKSFLNRYGHIRFCEEHGLPQRTPASKLRGDCGCERAPRAVGVLALDVV